VRALVRPGYDFRTLERAGAQVVPGDLKDRGSLDPACRNVDAIITTANSALRGGADNPQSVDLQGNFNLIDAAKAASVSQFIFVSAMAACPGSPVPLLAAKGRTEEYLLDSGIPCTILAPNAFMESWVGRYIGSPARERGSVTIVGQGWRRHSFIACTDVARFLRASIGNPKALNRKLRLGGPEAVTLRQVVAAYERALGKTIPVQCVRPGEPVPGLPQALWALAASFDTFDSPLDMDDTARVFGIRLTSLEEFVRDAIENENG
jgi:NADH dehydrogenase